MTLDPAANASEPRETPPLLSRPAMTLVALAAMVAIPYAVPLPKSLAPLRVLTAREEPASVAPIAPPENPGEGAVALSTDTKDNSDSQDNSAPKAGLPFGEAEQPAAPVMLDEAPPRPIEDPSGHALDAFFASLSQTEKKVPGAITRITYYGDSIIASDWITSTLRRKLQGRYGDSGHGFVLIADAWPGYHHDGISRFASKGWKVSRVVGPYAPDGLYGLGGVSFLADGPGMFAQVSTASSGDIGRAVSKFIVTYAEQPGGGQLSLKLDDHAPDLIATAAEATRVTTKTINAPDGPHKLEIRSNGGGGVRVFHVVLERDEPGVVVDAVGIIGCRLRFLDKIDDEHWKEELQRRDPALIAFTYGANESGDSFAYPMDQYEASARAVLSQARADLPKASCILIGPMDAAEKRGDGYTTRAVTPAINTIQRKLAAELGCAFFDTYQAMGGFGSMGVWIQKGLGAHDLVHPTSTGADVLGTWVYRALMDSYAKYKSRLCQTPCEGGRVDNLDAVEKRS